MDGELGELLVYNLGSPWVGLPRFGRNVSFTLQEALKGYQQALGRTFSSSCFKQSASELLFPPVPPPASPLLLSCEFQHTIYTSTLRYPSAQRRGCCLFFFFFCSSKTPHIYLYSKLQLYTVLTLFSVVILTAATHNYLCLHPSDLQFSTLI